MKIFTTDLTEQIITLRERREVFIRRLEMLKKIGSDIDFEMRKINTYERLK